MSSQKKRQSDTKTKERVSRPRKYKVIMFNDDYTPMEFVIQILEQIFRGPIIWPQAINKVIDKPSHLLNQWHIFGLLVSQLMNQLII